MKKEENRRGEGVQNSLIFYKEMGARGTYKRQGGESSGDNGAYGGG